VDFGQALNLNPHLTDTYCSRGVAWLAQSQLEKAEADFTRCRAQGGAPRPEAEKLLREAKRQQAQK